MASPIADFVVTVGADGHISSSATVSDALAKDETLAHEAEKEADVVEKAEHEVVDVEKPDAKPKQADGKLIVAEEMAEGHVSWKSCK
jgi:hypothetical protein